MARGPTWQHNKTVELSPESELSRRMVFEIAVTHDVRWIQCPRCRRRWWYALVEDTPPEERWAWGKRLRAQMLGRPCAEHADDDASPPEDGSIADG